MTKKTVLLISCLVFLFCGCSKTNKNTVVFEVGGAPNEISFWEEIIKDFQQQSGIKVEIIRQPTDTDQRRQGLVVALKSNKNNPDVFLMDVAWISQFAASGWLENLDNYLKADKVDTGIFFKNVINLSDKYNNNTIALPVYVDGGMLYYRKDLLNKYGFNNAPVTWDQLIEYSLKIQKQERKTNPGFYGFVWQGAQYEGLICSFIEFAGSNGGIIIKDNQIKINTPANIKTLGMLCDLIHIQKISPPNIFTEMKEEEVRTFFQQGDALFERNWPYAWSLHQNDDSAVKGKVGLASVPHFAGNKSASTLGGWHIGISKFSDAKDLSWEFVKFTVSYETQKKLAMKLGWNPGRKDIYKDREIKQKFPHFSYLGNIFENLTPRPNLPYYTQISEIMQKHINSALSGKTNPETALKEAELEINNSIKRYLK
ncbi:MAG: transcriptional antiterminator [Elusimicrobia bacterium RIFOXYA2_FULL_39_19]|nr:MAG: transcriptional antiterminator [Elusimicrobia bacterium RIFOXYA2_FULL_39_19]